MSLRKLTVLGIFLLAGIIPAFGNEIYLKNGDKITGEIIEETEKGMTILTDAMGTVTIQKDFVEGQVGESTVPAEEPVVLEEPKPAWTRNLSLGYSQAGGNTEKSHGTAAIKASRKTDEDEWTAKGNAYYSSSDQKMDAKKFYGMGRYAYSIGDGMRWYHFYKLEADQDRFANIDYRLIPSTGVGYWFSDEPDLKLMVETALGYEHTQYRDDSKSSNEAILIPRGYLETKLNEHLTVSQDIILYPSLSDIGEYRMHSESALINALSEKLSLKLSFIDDFNSDPVGSTQENDYRFISSVDYAF